MKKIREVVENRPTDQQILLNNLVNGIETLHKLFGKVIQPMETQSNLPDIEIDMIEKFLELSIATFEMRGPG